MFCRLCLKDIADVIEIFSNLGLELNVASVLSKFFWFEPKDDDPISTAVCKTCWSKVSDFNAFYKTVEQAHRLLTERFLFKNKNFDKKQQQEHMLLKVYDENQDETQEIQNKLVDKIGCQEMLSKSNEIQDEIHTTEEVFDFDDDDDGNDKDMVSIVDELIESPKEQENITEDNKNLTTNRITRSKTRNSNIPVIKVETGHNVRTISQSSNESQSSIDNLKAFKDVKEYKKRALSPKNNLKTMQSNKSPPIASKSVVLQKSPTKQIIFENELPANSEKRKSNIDAKISSYLRLTCDICASEQTNFGQLRKHIEQIHNSRGYAVCCGKKFYKRILLADHIEKHLNPNCYRCNTCDKVFSDRQCMRNHFLLKHVAEEKKTFQCKNCPKKFVKMYLLEQHRIIHEERTHSCSECDKAFATTTLLKTHIKSAHTESGMMCEICAKVLRGKAAFDKHMLEHRGIVAPKVQCDKCGSWHKDKYSLQKHKRRHNEEGLMHVCNICGKSAPNRSAMLSHQRYVHASERIFDCSVCRKSFKRAINLKEHMATHTRIVLYKCLHCPKTFNSNANMHSHRKKCHPIEFEEARKKRYENRSKMTEETDKTADEILTIRETTIKDKEITLQNEECKPEVITLNAYIENGETKSLIVTTEDFSDVDEDGEGHSIIFTVQ